ncbi:MAG: low molecular weight protein-tyrosine-phosphatase [Bacteroidia bacterium]
MKKVLFVCLGNICRSPLAEGLFLHKVQNQILGDQIEVDSCGTGGWHVGHEPDARSLKVAAQYGIVLSSRARKLRIEDFATYDYIIAMDRSNLRDLRAQQQYAEENKAQMFLMRDFDPLGKSKDVPDPYYGGEEGFQNVYEMLDRSTTEFLDFIQKNDLK